MGRARARAKHTIPVLHLVKEVIVTARHCPTVSCIDGQSLGIAYVSQCAQGIACPNIGIKYFAGFPKGLTRSA